ncbi:MAG: chemotaxis-specific protein-glutamate methyltransferase CheB [Polyangiaceae bacterium]
MSKVRVVVVAHLASVRRGIAEGLARDAAIEVAASASSGPLALRRIEELGPDVVVLDMTLVEPSGLKTLTAIRKQHPQVRVVVFGGGMSLGATASVEALLAGASDYVSAPSGPVGADSANALTEALGAKVKALRAALPVTKRKPLPSARAPAQGPASRVDIVVIGASTGGPDALAVLLRRLPANLPVPVVIVQHMPAAFTRYLVERFAATSAIPIEAGEDGQVLEPGRAYLAPGDHHMVVRDGGGAARISIHQAPPENSCRPSVDVLLRSVAHAYGRHSLATILTGMGHDGLQGCELVAAQGGQIFAQDEASSVVWGMPGGVVNAGLARTVLPPSLLATEIARATKLGRDAH